MESTDTRFKGKLERLVLIAVRNLQRKNDRYVSAKEVVKYLEENFEKKYFPQTITTVLKRLEKKQVIHKYNFGANRCSYFDPRLRSGGEGDLIWEKFQEFADEFYFGDIETAINKLNAEVLKRIKLIKTKEKLFPESASNP